jgi:hypothetical protein
MLKELFRAISQFMLTLFGPIILIVAGVALAGFGLSQDWQWLMYGGVVVAIVGVIFIARIWFDNM